MSCLLCSFWAKPHCHAFSIVSSKPENLPNILRISINICPESSSFEKPVISSAYSDNFHLNIMILDSIYSICPYVFSCKIFVKSDFFLFIPIWNIVVMRKKGIAFFSNSLNLWKLTKSKMSAMFPRFYLFHHNFWNNEHKNMYNISICIVFKTRKLITPLYFRHKQFKLDFFRV